MQIFHHKMLMNAGLILTGGVLIFGGWGLRRKNNQTPIKPRVTQRTVTNTTEVNLLDGQWGYLAGATKDGDGLHLTPINLSLFEQDGSVAEPNPPVNLYGTHLGIDKQVSILLSLDNLQGKSGISLYGNVPVVIDEARFETASLRLEIDKETMRIELRNPTKDQVIETKTYTIAAQANHEIKATYTSSTISLTIDGKPLGDIKARDIFKNKHIWFGFDTDGKMTVKQLKAQGDVKAIDTSTLAITGSDPNGLQQLAEKKRPGFLIGAAVSLEPLVANSGYSGLLGSGWYGAVTTENALKANTSHPQENTYNFTNGDAIVDFAQRHRLAVHGHATVFGEANPAWMQQKAADNPAAMEGIMVDHVKMLVSHYKGKIDSWDIVNEPFDDDNQLRDHIWHQTMGEDYITKAFQAAHEANPDAKLYINEYGLEGSISDSDNDRWDAFSKLIDRQLKNGAPINGVGFQAHVDEDGDMIKPEVFRGRVRELAKRGLLVRISEMDVTGEDSTKQAQQFADILRVCVEESNCTSFTTWGIGEGTGATAWIERSLLQTADSLPFDKKMQPRKPVSSMQAVLR